MAGAGNLVASLIIHLVALDVVMDPKCSVLLEGSEHTDARLKREDLLPGNGLPYLERLRAARAIDLHDNAAIEHLPGGYIRVRPIDPSKRFG